MAETVNVLIDEETVEKRIKELGEKISEDYAGKQVHLICGKRGALLVQKVRNALQQNGRFARAGNAVDQQNGHILVPDNNVLFALDSCSDGLQLLGVLTL